ncbi:hypothetical protein C6379_24870, partial [Pseudomonas syringae pv. actinidiae]
VRTPSAAQGSTVQENEQGSWQVPVLRDEARRITDQGFRGEYGRYTAQDRTQSVQSGVPTRSIGTIAS